MSGVVCPFADLQCAAVCIVKSRRADLAFRTTKQERWNQRAQDRQAHQDFLEEHRGTGKFSGKYAPQPQQTELIWTMPWGCWVELRRQGRAL